MLDYFQNLIANCVSKWRPVVGYEGLYEVSADGQVRSLPRRVDLFGKMLGRSRTLPGNDLIPVGQKDKYRYYWVSVSKLGAVKRRLIHTLVAEAFIGKRPDGFDVDHIDGDTHNNCIANLRYVTRSVNVGKLDARERPLLGTSFNKSKGLYRAYIQINYKQINLGYYKTRDEAVAVRRKKEIEMRGKDSPIRGDQ